MHVPGEVRVCSDTHRLSRLPVPVKSGNSVICEAPFRVLGEIRECYLETVLGRGHFDYHFFFPKYLKLYHSFGLCSKTIGWLVGTFKRNRHLQCS